MIRIQKVNENNKFLDLIPKSIDKTDFFGYNINNK